ncbi:MAG: hypothetical protein AB1714_00815 [Acidobacteriota bacterium]
MDDRPSWGILFHLLGLSAMVWNIISSHGGNGVLYHQADQPRKTTTQVRRTGHRSIARCGRGPLSIMDRRSQRCLWGLSASLQHRPPRLASYGHLAISSVDAKISKA